jgi:F0F1-type ATP synthase assembly protein I
MKKAAAHTTPTADSTKSSLTIGSIGLQFLDTLWRVGVPIILFTILGIFADRHLGTKPWLTLLGIAIGFVGAALLIKQLISDVSTPGDKK